MKYSIRLFVLAFIYVTLTTTIVAFPQSWISSRSDNCGPISGQTQEDFQNLKTLCEKGLPEKGVVSAAAVGEMLWIEVTREIADSIRADHLTAKQLILNWMKIWKTLSGSRSVIVYVLWGEIEIAKGDTTIFSGDVITFQ